MAVSNISANQNVSSQSILPGGCVVTPKEPKKEQIELATLPAQSKETRGSVSWISEKFYSPLAKTVAKVAVCATALIIVGTLAFCYKFSYDAQAMKRILETQEHRFRNGHLFAQWPRESEPVGWERLRLHDYSHMSNIDVCTDEPIDLLTSQRSPFENVNTPHRIQIIYELFPTLDGGVYSSRQHASGMISELVDSLAPGFGRIGFFMHGISRGNQAMLEVGLCRQTPLQQIASLFV